MSSVEKAAQAAEEEGRRKRRPAQRHVMTNRLARELARLLPAVQHTMPAPTVQ